MREWAPIQWLKRSLIIEGLNSLAGFLGFGNPLGAFVTFVGALMMGWWTAAQTWSEESVLKSYGTAGYVVTVLVVAILALSAAWLAANVWRALSVGLKAKSLKHDYDVTTISTSNINTNDDLVALREHSRARTQLLSDTMERLSVIESLTERLYRIEYARQTIRRLNKEKQPLILARQHTLNRPSSEVDQYTFDSAVQLERKAIEMLVVNKLISMKDLRYELKIAEERGYGEAAKDREANPGKESHVTAHKTHVAKLRRLEELMDSRIRRLGEQAEIDLLEWKDALTPPPAAPTGTPSPAGTAQKTQPRTRPG